MKASVFLCAVVCASVAAAIPATSGIFGPPPIPAAAAAFIPSAAMIKSFIPTPEELAALNALASTPAPGPGGPLTPFAPPTMPPAVANLVNKYKMAAAAFTTPSPPTPVV